MREPQGGTKSLKQKTKNTKKDMGGIIKIKFTYFKFLPEAIPELFKRKKKTFSVSSYDTDGSLCLRHGAEM